MRPVVLFVLGAPGVGKTTLVRGLLGSNTTITQPSEPKWTFGGNGIVAAGHYTGQTFDGADTVPYNGARKALDYWAKHIRTHAHLTIFDGARFSTRPSLEYIAQLAPDHLILGVHLIAEEQVDARRVARGSNQDPTWLKGATTRARNFAEMVGACVVDASGHPDDVRRIVQATINVVRREAA